MGRSNLHLLVFINEVCSLDRTPIAVDPSLIASSEYSTWKRRPSGEKVLHCVSCNPMPEWVNSLDSSIIFGSCNKHYDYAVASKLEESRIGGDGRRLRRS